MSINMDAISTVGWQVTSMDGIVQQALSWTTMIGAFLTSSFIALKFYYEYARYSVGAIQGNDVSIPWDWNEVVRVIFLCLVLSMYKPIASSFTESISYINSSTAPSTDINAKLRKAANKWYISSQQASVNEDVKMYKAQKKEYDASGNVLMSMVTDQLIQRSKIEPVFGTDGTPDGGSQQNAETNESMANGTYGDKVGASMFGGDFMANAINGITLLVSSLIKWAIGTFMGVVFKLAIVFGPIVLAFGVFFREKPINFLNKVLTIGLVFTTMNVLDMIFMQFMMDSLTEPSVKEAIAFNIAMIGSYYSAFKMTTWFVGDSGMTSLMSRGVGAAVGGIAAGVGAAAAVSTGGASMAASSAASSSRGSNTNVD